MTLIVARTHKGHAHMVADSRIWDPAKVAKLEDTRLKIAFPRPDLMLGYSGDPDIADADLLSYRRNGEGKGFRDTVEHFRHASAGNANTYILAFGNGRLLRAEGGEATSHHSSTWAGSHAGFSAYQEYQSPPPPPAGAPEWEISILPNAPNQNLLFDSLDRLRKVADSGNVPEVGDFTYAAGNVDGVLQILMGASWYADREGLILDKLGRRHLQSLGEHATYRMIQMKPVAGNVSALLVAFPAASIGFAYAPTQQGGFGAYRGVVRGDNSDLLAAEALALTGVAYVSHDARPG